MSLNLSRKPLFCAVQSALLSFSTLGILALPGTVLGQQNITLDSRGLQNLSHSNSLCGNSTDTVEANAGQSRCSLFYNSNTLALENSQGPEIDLGNIKAYGAYNDKISGDAIDNALEITGIKIAGAYGAMSKTGAVERNHVRITSSKINNISGGEVEDRGGAYGNSVTVQDFSEATHVSGGVSRFSNAKNNKVEFSNSIAIEVYGGEVGNAGSNNGTPGNATDNSVSIKTGAQVERAYGGFSKNGDVINNRVEVDASRVYEVYGGQMAGDKNSNARGNVEGNSVSLKNAKVNSAYGGLNSIGGNADNNKVVVDNSQAVEVFGGVSDTSGNNHASGNYVYIQNGSVVSNATGGKVGNADSNAYDNHVVIQGNSRVDGTIKGGFGVSGNANNNSVTLQTGATTDKAIIYGGHTDHGTANENSITAQNVVFGNLNIYTAMSDYLEASRNTLLIKNSAVSDGIGGYVKTSSGGIANNNSLTLDNVTFISKVDGGEILGASAVKEAHGNTVTLINTDTRGVGGVGYTVTGGLGDTVSHNTVTLTDSSASHIIGGKSSGGQNTEAVSNTVTLTANNNPRAINGYVFGGQSNEGNVRLNTVTVTGNGAGRYEVFGNVFGGQSLNGGNAEQNTVNLDHTSIYGSVAGGVVANASGIAATGNTINLRGNVQILGSASTPGGGNLYGGHCFDGSSYGCANNNDARTGNTLNVYDIHNDVKDNMGNFSVLNFYIHAASAQELAAQGPRLKVGGTARIDGSQVNVGIDGSSFPLTSGDKITLIDAGTVDGMPDNSKTNGLATGMQGVTLNYTFNLSKETAGTTEQLVAILNSSQRINPRAKSLSEGFLGGLAHVRQGQDGAARMLEAPCGQANGTTPCGQGVFGLAKLEGGSYRHDTGSSVKINSQYLNLGALWRPDDRLSLAGLLEIGNGNYRSRNDFENLANVKGNGHLESTGLAILARRETPEWVKGSWVEGSIRGGHIYQDFNSQDLLSIDGRAGNYHLSTTYWGAHIGLGNRWEVSEHQALEARAQLLWSQENGQNVTLGSGDGIRFKTADSKRLVLGGRYNWKLENQTRLYAGLAWEQEFSGKAKAMAYNLYAIHTPELKGATGIMEVGLSKETGRLKLEGGVQAAGGKREGIGGFVQASWKF